jgi:hypothetical protein
MHCELFSSEHRRNGLELADGNSPLRQVLAAPGGDAGPLACGAPANSNVLAGFLAGRSTGRRPVPPISHCENLKVVSFAANSRGPWQSGPSESAHCPGHLSAGRPESHSRLSSPFSGIPAASVFPQAGRPARGRVRPAAVIRAGIRDPGAAPRPDRHGPNLRPPAQIRSNLPRGSSTARYFIPYRIKVT